MKFRTLAITAEVIDDAPEAVSLADVEEAVRIALENQGFEVGVLDVRIVSQPERRRA